MVKEAGWTMTISALSPGVRYRIVAMCGSFVLSHGGDGKRASGDIPRSVSKYPGGYISGGMGQLRMLSNLCMTVSVPAPDRALDWPNALPNDIKAAKKIATVILRTLFFFILSPYLLFVYVTVKGKYAHA